MQIGFKWPKYRIYVLAFEFGPTVINCCGKLLQFRTHFIRFSIEMDVISTKCAFFEVVLHSPLKWQVGKIKQ